MLDGGVDAFKARLGDQRGHPVVVNQWASWCGPCRFEFPFFARQASKYADRVAFLGVDSQDSRADAKAFLEQRPVPYPQYFDPDGSIARVFRGGRAFPTTAFYDAAGKLPLHGRAARHSLHARGWRKPRGVSGSRDDPSTSKDVS